MAWRPWYQPQLPQTMCGRLVAPQRGQMLRDGANTRQADARRMRVLDFDIFCFGTGMLLSDGPLRPWFSALKGRSGPGFPL